MHGHRVVYPEHLAISRLDMMGGDAVSKELGQVLLIHAGDVVEAGAELVDVRADARALGRDVRVVLHHEEVARLEIVLVPR